MGQQNKRKQMQVVYFVEIILIKNDKELSFELIFKEYPTQEQLLNAFEQVKTDLEYGDKIIEKLNSYFKKYGYPILNNLIGYIPFGEDEEYGFITIREFPILDNVIDSEIEISNIN